MKKYLNIFLIILGLCMLCTANAECQHKYAWCDAPGLCTECGEEAEGLETVHALEYVYDVNVPETHKQICSRCDDYERIFSHRIYCPVAGKCIDCGYEDASLNPVAKACSFTGDSWQYVNLDECQIICDVCGSPSFDKQQHITACFIEGCSRCGATNCNYAWVEHVLETMELKDLGDTHAMVCGSCGQPDAGSIDEHYAFCTAPETCNECGHAWPSKIIHKNLNPEWLAAAGSSMHYQYCPDCDKNVNHDYHTQSCINMGVCKVCGMEDVTFWFGQHNYVSPDNPEVCYKICADCGEKDYEYPEHEVFCAEPETCYNCGQKVTVSTEEMLHAHQEERVGDAEYHWWTCACGYEVYGKDRHQGECYNGDGTCIQCGLPYSGSNLTHTYPETWTYDDSYHWGECLGECGTITGKARHVVDCQNPGICSICQAECDLEVDHTFVNDPEYMESDGEYHWKICSKCKTPSKEKEAHYALCDQKETCAVCQAVYLGNDVHHNESCTDFLTFRYDEEQHWYGCANCDVKKWPSEHIELCGMEGECHYCKAECDTDEVEHYAENDEWQTDLQNHWRVCSHCEKVFDKTKHFSYCDERGICGECGGEHENLNLYHYMSFEYSSDEYRHWRRCNYCGAREDIAAHTASCANPDVCKDCGAPCKSNEYSHSFVLNEVQEDEYYHWYTCKDCGADSKAVHTSLCTEPGVCCTCKESYSGPERTHYIDTNNFCSDETSHWLYCLECGEKTFESSHSVACYSAPGICETCFAEVDIEWQHTINPARLFADENGHWSFCLICDEYIRPVPHLASCSEPGKCSVCDYEDQNIPAYHPHLNGIDMEYDAYHHAYFCAECESDVLEEHTLQNGICSYCRQDPSEFTCKHYVTKWTVTLEPTCTEEGLKQEVCTKCEEEVAVESVPVADHEECILPSVPATRVTTGLGEGVGCLHCETVLEEQVVIPFVNVEPFILPANVTDVFEEAFVNTQIECLVIPDGCWNIQAKAFAGNTALRFAEIPSSVEHIDKSAFENCSDEWIIVTVAESAAHLYAEELGITYVLIDE